jgi:hypothetical protein
MKKLLSFALAGVTALALGGAVRAEDSAPKAEKPAVEKPAAVAPLTDESLAKMLTDMGYEYKTEPVKGTVIYKVTTTQDGWTFHLQVALSADKQQLWISTPVVTLADENIPSTALLRLLEENHNIGPTGIYYDKKFKQISLALPLLNRGGITPSVLRTYINDFTGSVKSTMKLCEFAKPGEKTGKDAKIEPTK